MKYYRLFDFMAPVDGDLYKVDPSTGDTWMLNAQGEDPIVAFGLSAKEFGTTQFEQLVDYASKHGRLEEAECPVS